MSNNLFITSTEGTSGKSVVALGVMEMLLRKIEKVGFFRPIIDADSNMNGVDDDINLILSYFKLDIPYEQTYGYTTTQVSEFISSGKEGLIIEGIIEKYNQLKKDFDFVLCEGTDFRSSISSYEFDINAEICNNLKSPVLLVANAYHKSIDETIRLIELALESFNDKRCHVAATIVNQLNVDDRAVILEGLKEHVLAQDQLIYSIPDEPYLRKPSVGEVAKFIGAEVLFGEDQLNRHVDNFTVAAMQLRNFLTRIGQGSLIITPGDRADVIVACLAVVSSKNLDNISGILLTGGLRPEESILKLIEGFPQVLPILGIKENTFETASLVSKIHSKIFPEDERKITRALSVFESNVNVEQLQDCVVKTQTSIVTPKMFEYELLQKARKHKQHIVLPEGEEERILIAAEKLLRREIVDITFLGNEQLIRKKILRIGLHLDAINVVDPERSECFDDFVKTYFEMRQHKGMTMEKAYDVMCDVGTYGTMMVQKGQADGMVSGAVHSTSATIRPAFEIIKISPDTSIASSVFFMCLEDRVLVYGDCAVCSNPDSKQLAEIAVNSALTAKAFGIAPIVAMLSYSTGESGKGEDVDKVREATAIAQKKAKGKFPEMKIDGPIQYDAAVDPLTAQTKMPESEVAGKATVFIFPDLNTGNNTYKAVQRTAGVVAIGPVLQGLNHPVNDLSRGCTIPDIVNTVAITAIQAQLIKGLT